MKSLTIKTFYSILCASLMISLIGIQPAYAASFSVSTAAELIAAINTANTNNANDVITLTADITLTTLNNSTNGPNGLPAIQPDSGNSLTIEGAGFTISRDGTAPAFRIFTARPSSNFRINELTISNGNGSTNGGGAIYSITGATVTITNSTITGNTALGSGGGIYNQSSTLIISNSTISGNTSSGGFGGGGIINLFSSTATIINSTISGNSASNGGGIRNFNSTLNYSNTIIANSTGGDCSNNSTIGTNINNLVEDNTCSPLYSGDPSLGTLTDNGGPTHTHALTSISAAIDKGDATTCSNSPISNLDQRGVTRPVDGDATPGAVCDIGAFEYVPPPEMDLRDNADTLDILDGDITPITTDGTDMGSTLIGGTGVTSTFRIENNSNGSLTLTNPFSIGGANPADFSITSAASTPVTANSFTNFTIRCIPSAAGTRTADISITNNDPDENPYNFRVQCNGVNYPTIEKAFSPNAIAVGGTSILTFTLTNPNPGAALTGLNFTDTLPAGMEIAATPNIGGTCNSNNVLATHFTPNLAAAGTAINLVSGSGYSLAANASCTITIDVTATTVGLKNNTSGVIGSTETGASTDNASDTLTVGNGPVVIYGANTIPSDGATLTTGPTQIFVEFNKDLNPTTAQDTANYLLVEEGVIAGFQTVDCATGVDANDTQVTVNSASYSNAGSLYVSTLGVNGGAALPVGSYRLYVCGTTSIEDTIGIELNDGLSDSLLDFTVAPVSVSSVSSLPDTGFAPNRITSLPTQSTSYTNLGDIWMEIPSLDVKTSVVGVPQSTEGWNVDWLAQSAGWLHGTAFPSWEGNSVVTAHVYDSNGLPGPFQQIKNLKYGEQIIVHMFGEKYIFEVRESKMVFPSSTKSALEHLEGNSYLTLITCQWYNPVTDSYAFRRVVRAVLVKIEGE